MKRTLLVLGVVLVVLVAASGGGALVLHRRSQHRAQVAAEHRRDAERVAAAFLSDWSTRHYDAMTALTAGSDDPGSAYRRLDTSLQTTDVAVRPGAVSANGSSVPYDVTVSLKGLGDLSWSSTVETTRVGGQAKVLFRSTTVYPGLQNGQRLQRSASTQSVRGQLLDRTGKPLRAASADLASNVLGSAGTKPTGLERVDDSRLGGSGGGRVDIVDVATGGSLSTVKDFAPHVGAGVRTTLDITDQRAAEQALASVPASAGQAGMVVLDLRTSEVRAIADRPVSGLPAALKSEAPGSTFKIVTALAALMHGYTTSTTVPCPAHSPAHGGRSFANDEALPASLSLVQAFALSCNTAFIDVADHLPQGSLRTTAPLLGFDLAPILPIAADGGQVPEPSSTAEGYADAIGQGTVEASPLLMASVAAAIGSGAWHQPHLDAAAPGVTHALPAGPVAALRTMMAAVVTGGTAKGAGLPAGTHGKTGTAQYGPAGHLRSHAWFTGWSGDLAYCVYLQTGASGGSSAAPVAARFLRSVAGRD